VRCDGDQVVTVESGAAVLTDGSSWNGVAKDTPYNLRVLQLSTSGKGDVVRDNTEDILAELVVPAAPGAKSSYFGCSVSSTSSLSRTGHSLEEQGRAPLGWLSLASLGFFAAFARRRHIATFPRQTDNP
jgi:hypothetical protein